VAPPDTVAHPAIEGLPTPSLPALPQRSPFVLGLSTVDHSGRIRDRVVLTALNWHSGDRTRAAIRGTTVLIRRAPTGGVAIDTRGRVFLPAGARTFLGISIDERIVLLANLLHDLLVVHPTRVVTALLTTHCHGEVEAIRAACTGSPGATRI